MNFAKSYDMKKLRCKIAWVLIITMILTSNMCFTSLFADDIKNLQNLKEDSSFDLNDFIENNDDDNNIELCEQIENKEFVIFESNKNDIEEKDINQNKIEKNSIDENDLNEIDIDKSNNDKNLLEKSDSVICDTKECIIDESAIEIKNDDESNIVDNSNEENYTEENNDINNIKESDKNEIKAEEIYTDEDNNEVNVTGKNLIIDCDTNESDSEKNSIEKNSIEDFDEDCNRESIVMEENYDDYINEEETDENLVNCIVTENENVENNENTKNDSDTNNDVEDNNDEENFLCVDNQININIENKDDDILDEYKKSEDDLTIEETSEIMKESFLNESSGLEDKKKENNNGKVEIIEKDIDYTETTACNINEKCDIEISTISDFDKKVELDDYIASISEINNSNFLNEIKEKIISTSSKTTNSISIIKATTPSETIMNGEMLFATDITLKDFAMPILSATSSNSNLLLFGANTYGEKASSYDEVHGNSWMQFLDNDMYISDVNIPGTHNSGSKGAKMLGMSVGAVQGNTIAEQLEMGVRFLDIRLSKKTNTELEVIHGVSDCGRTLDGDMDDILDFLKNNPSEFIIMSVKQDDDEEDDGSNLIAPVFRYSYIDVYNEKYKTATGKDLFYIEDRVPKINEVRGQVVIMRRFFEEFKGHKAYDDISIGLNFRNWVDDGWTLKKHENYYHAIQDCYKLSTSNAGDGANEKIANIDEFFDDIDGFYDDDEYKNMPGILINFASCYNSSMDYLGDGVSKYSDIINEHIIDKYEEWENEGVRYGIVPLDFVNKKPDVVKVIYKANVLIATCEHNVETWTVINESTCTTNGLKSGICTICGNEVSVSIPLKDHTCVWEKTVNETCTEQGKKENKCTICGTVTEIENIPATGHTCVWEKTVDETCTEQGKKENKCTICGTVIEIENIPATGHTCVWEKTIEETCTVQGEKEYKCTICGTVTDIEYIPLKEHNCVWVKTINETCLINGEEKNTCTVCGNVVDTRTIPALGHDVLYAKVNVDSKECIKESCSRCSHEAYAKVKFSSMNLMYDGLAKEPCSIEYSDEWYSAKNVIGTYINNVNVGNATYKMTKDSVVASNNFTILKATSWAAPTGIKSVNASVCASTTKGRIKNVSSLMEYKKEGGSYQSISGTEITELDVGSKGSTGVKYYVRFKETNNHVASSDVVLTIKYVDHEVAFTTINNGGINSIKEYCTLCSHSAFLKPKFTNTSFMYDGIEKKPGSVEYIGDWYSDKNITEEYLNNINVGTATYRVKRGSLTIDNNFTITKATSWSAPTGISSVDAECGKDDYGKITGVNAEMEYKKEGKSYSNCVGSEINGLEPGKYYVRLKNNINHVASSDVIIEIGKENHDLVYSIFAKDSTVNGIKESCSKCSHISYAYPSKLSSICVYNGSEIKPFTVAYDNNWLSSKDLTLTYENNINASTNLLKAKCILKKTSGGNVCAETLFVIEKANQNKPTVKSIKNALCGSNTGEIIFASIDIAKKIEYRPKNGSFIVYGASNFNSEKITKLNSGDYELRYKEDNNHFASEGLIITINTSGHSLRYIKYENKIKEICDNCSHVEYTELIKPTSMIFFNNEEQRPLSVKQSQGWLGVKINASDIVYQNNKYKGTANGTLNILGVSISENFEIKKAILWPAPENLDKVDATNETTANGKITNVIKNEMEYRAKNGNDDDGVGGEYILITESSQNNLFPGIYFVRYIDTENHPTSAPIAITISATKQKQVRPITSGGGGGGGEGGGGGGGGVTASGTGVSIGLNPLGNVVSTQDKVKVLPIKSNEIQIVPMLENDTEWQENSDSTWSLLLDKNSKNSKAINGFYILVSHNLFGQQITKTYYFDENGKMVTGWLKDSIGTMYYFETNKLSNEGVMMAGWKEIEGFWYYFGMDGKMLVNTMTPDGSFVGTDGKWIDPNAQNMQ